MTTVINILVRKSRPELFKRLMASIDHDVNVIVHDDTAQRNRHPYDWNLFCNDLKAQVDEGYFLYADDDDLFVPGSLAKLDDLLNDNPDGLIVQFLRKGTVKKPTDFMIDNRMIKYGVIGGGCLVLSAKYKNISDWRAIRGADFFWIQEVNSMVNLKFCHLVLQIAPNGGNHGK